MHFLILADASDRLYCCFFLCSVIPFSSGRRAFQCVVAPFALVSRETMVACHRECKSDCESNAFYILSVRTCIRSCWKSFETFTFNILKIFMFNIRRLWRIIKLLNCTLHNCIFAKFKNRLKYVLTLQRFFYSFFPTLERL